MRINSVKNYSESIKKFHKLIDRFEVMQHDNDLVVVLKAKRQM